MLDNKIKEIEDLAGLIDSLKKQGKKIVHCHGCFDIVHPGHIEHFIDAKKQGDVLVVTVTPDRFVEKGPGRPFFNEKIRLKQLAAQGTIDYVALNKWSTAIETLRLIKPDIYVKGKEVLGNKDIDKIQTTEKISSNLSLEEEAVKSVGGELYLTDQITFSSSKIINQITEAIPDESKKFLENLKQSHSSQDILKILDSLKDIRIIVIGDSILDEYVYCESMEKSGKETQVSYKFLDSETHLGGIFAIANHLAGFVKDIAIITCIGKNNYNFIEEGLKQNIERNIFTQSESKTLIKTRYIDNYKKHKVFQNYNTDELKINLETEEKILRFLENNLQRFDMVLVPDFGHGMLTQRIIDLLTNSNKFLAINCQLNSGNLGYNFITKYPRADFVSINDRELRLPFQEKKGDIRIPIKKLNQKLNVNKINITLGKKGNIFYDNGEFIESPSFTTQPLDTIGSGDAVLSLTSLLAYKNTDPMLISFLGNSIGGLATRIIGNQRSVDPIELRKFINYILK
ncbi:adenylyltransferase/cytidyltransferase family protein [archaeon]|jgi:cytidyltransferase-like protein|nr:adenylyltransferase/cytidyltransferase family protein [archaeon]